MATPQPQPDEQIRALQRRLSWLERQWRMLLTEFAVNAGHEIRVCVDSRCRNGPVPHMTEKPYGCPRTEGPEWWQ